MERYYVPNLYYKNKRSLGCSKQVQIPDSVLEHKLHEAASWNFNLQLPRSKLPIQTPTLRDNIAKWCANEQPVSL